MKKIYRKKTREIRKCLNGKYNLWVLMDSRKLGLIDNSKLNHVKNLDFTKPVWIIAEASKSYNYIINANNKYKYIEEWKDSVTNIKFNNYK
tara:strand:+ start:473 stop:745 length:273 start_codon:yes stop_codon:yes gene_type:complete